MLAQLLRWPDDRRVVEDDGWAFERKHDGLRGIAVRSGAGVELWSRNHLSFRARFPAVVSALASLPVPDFVLDGEIVAATDPGLGFSALQQGGEARYVVFDVLWLLGRDTTGLPWEERADLVGRTIATGAQSGIDDRIVASERLDGRPGDLMEMACAAGWEGLVAKRLGSAYRSGRSPDWRKLKCTARQELVVIGWTDPSGARTGFGALLVGHFEEGQLVYAGRVGTGFDERTLRSLHATLVNLPPLTEPPANAPRLPGAHWVEPRLVAEVGFAEWTRDGMLRHPRFLGLRPDKDPLAVVREDRSS